MRVIILGAGAVGVTLGLSLEHKKHEVLYLVRKGRKKSLRSLILVDVRTGEARRRDAPTVYEMGERLPPFEHVLICVRGDQLSGALDEIKEAIRPDATLGIAAAHRDDLAMARSAHPEGAIYRLVPTFSAWSEEAGVFHWFPAPLLPSLLSGEGDARGDLAAQGFAQALEEAGVPAKAVRSTRRLTEPLFGSGLPLLAAWELAEWDAARLASDRALRVLTAEAMREGARIACAETGGAVAGVVRSLPASALSLLMRALPRVTRGRAGAMWAHHGPKIRAQTRAMIDGLLERAEANAIEAPRLRELRSRLPQLT